MAGTAETIRIIFDNMPYLAWMKDRDGNYLEVNQAFLQFCGKEASEIIGRSVRDIFAVNIAEAYCRLDEAVLRYKEPQVLDHIYNDNDCATDSEWFDTYVAPMVSERGRIEGTIGFSRRISRRKRLEMELEHQKRFLKTMMDTIPDIVVYKDNESRILGCNKACLENFYGAIDEGAVVGKRAIDILSDKVLAKNCLEKDFAVFVANQTRKNEEKYVLVDGAVVAVETIKTPYHDDRGRVRGLISVSRDITERKKLEQELRCREQETRRELELAARVQRDMLPQPLDGEKVRVDTLFVPYNTVSGDLFNYRWFDDQQKLCGYIVDVSGHGVATALQTATLKMHLDTVLLAGEGIDESDFQQINKRILQYLQEESFAGIMYFEFDFQTAILTVISGGLNLFLSATPERSELISVFSGFLGMFETADVQTVTRPFKAGDVFCMMTDGVSDLLELQGVSVQQGMSGYREWLEGIVRNSERWDDCAAVIIEIIQTEGEFNVVCSAVHPELARQQERIGRFLEDSAPQDAIMLEVAVNEAVNNGLAAGNRARIKMKRLRDRLVIRVKDSGPGFDTAAVRCHLNNAAYEEAFDTIRGNDHGRGIMLMQMLCDKLLYNDKGNEVMLVKKLTATGDKLIDFEI